MKLINDLKEEFELLYDIEKITGEQYKQLFGAFCDGFFTAADAPNGPIPLDDDLEGISVVTIFTPDEKLEDLKVFLQSIGAKNVED